MTKFLIAALAMVAFIGGGALLYTAAQNDLKPEASVIYPEMNLPTSTTQMIPVEKEPDEEVEETKETTEEKKEEVKEAIQKLERTYAAHNPKDCSLAVYVCGEGEESFYDETGCGCESSVDKNNNDDSLGGGPAATYEKISVQWGEVFRINPSDNFWYLLPDNSILYIDRMVNEPCTEVCVWSGQEVYFSWQPEGGETVTLPPYNDFPYQLEIIKTDYETYAEVKVDFSRAKKIDEDYPFSIRNDYDGILIYEFQEHLTRDDYAAECAWRGGSFNSCSPSQCSTIYGSDDSIQRICTSDCNYSCALDQTD